VDVDLTPAASSATANNPTAGIGTGTAGGAVTAGGRRHSMATLTGVVAPPVTATGEDPAQLVNLLPTSLAVSASV
jgi:hypothetical protein